MTALGVGYSHVELAIDFVAITGTVSETSDGWRRWPKQICTGMDMPHGDKVDF